MSSVHYKSSSDNSVVKLNIIKIANELLRLCSKNDPSFKYFKIPPQIETIEQLNSNFYVYIYENVCNTELIDKKSPAIAIDDQVHNVQAVIDSLSMDVLHEDLSHLTGEAICGVPEPDFVSIEYLLDILRCIHDWISSRLESTIEMSNILPRSQNSNQPINVENNAGFNIEKNNFVESSNIILKCESEDLNGTDQNNNKESSIKSSNKFSFNDYETKQLINLIDDFENASLAKKIEDLEGSFKEEQEEEEDLFQSYMKQKQGEFERSKYLTDLELSSINQLNKSSSGKGTLSSASSVNSLESQDFLLSSRNLLPTHQYTHVTFDSKMPKNNKTRPRSTSKTRSEQVLLQTVNNELKSLYSNVEANSNEEQKRISYLLKSVYNEDLKDAESILKESLLKIKNRSDLTNVLYLNAFNNCNEDDHTRPKSGLSIVSSSKSKSVLKPTSRSVNHLSKFYLDEREKFRRSGPKSARNAKKAPGSDLFKSISHVSEPNAEFMSRFVIGEDGILNSLLHEFPYLYTSPETIHYLWQKHAKQIETFAKLGKEVEQTYLNKNSKSLSNSNLLVQSNISLSSLSQVFNKNKNKPQLKLEETYKKQQKIMEIMRKDIQHMQRMEDMKRKVEVENSMKAKAREQRFQNARVKRYYEEFRLQQRAKMLKKTTQEELIFKNLFNESLKIQKERILDLKRYAKEKAELSQKQQLNQISSIENFYKNKFDLLNEKLVTEKKNAQIRDKAQHQVLNSMKNQVKHKLETDIRDLQFQMSEDKDHIHWREMDAKRVQSDLYRASYLKKAK